MAKLVTAEQVGNVVNAINNKINTKLSKEDDSVTLNSLILRGSHVDSTDYDTITLSYNGSHKYIQAFISDGSSAVLAYATGNEDFGTRNLYVDNIVTHRTSSIGLNLDRIYAFPGSTDEAKLKATGSNGGGIILTTMNRSFQVMNYEDTDLPTNDLSIYPNIYSKVIAHESISISLVNALSGVGEYWIELTINPEASVEFVDNMIWAGGEPDWEELSVDGAIVQVHIIGNIATYVVIPITNDDEQ